MKTVQLETMPAEPPSAYGVVKTCTRPDIIQAVIGAENYHNFFMMAATELEPDFPEIAILHPVLSFNTAERAKISFYTSVTLGKLDEETPDLLSWSKKLPEDGGFLYQKTAKLMRWI